MTEMEIRVKEYLENDRQWLRALRLTHAKLQLSRAVTDQDKDFWQRIVKANSRGD